MKTWLQEKGLSEGFKVIDSDCDGAITKSDLKTFLISVLKKQSIYDTNIDRLFSILD